MEKRRGSMRALAADMAKIAAPALGKHGFATAQIVAEWPSVIGAELADQLAPDRLSFPRGERQGGTLRLRVAAGFATEAQHRSPQILERINGFFGYHAVARLVLVQGPLPGARRPAPKRPRPLTAAEETALDRKLAGIGDPDLRAALHRLGSAVIGREKL